MRRLFQRRRALVAALVLCLPAYGSAAGQAAREQSKTVVLDDWTYGDSYGQRWLDIANQVYSESYRNTYTYSDALVQVDYVTTGTGLTGTLTASNLKPNFAYQFQVWANSTAANERLGLIGRWNRYEWDGTWWSNGVVLNNKGDGSSPNPNDFVYLAQHDVVDKTSPTGRHYRFGGFLIFEYFVTDGNGNASVQFSTGSSYHVLWKESQRARATDDGPRLVHTFDPDPALNPAYDNDYAENTIVVFGEWERLPPGALRPPPGRYSGSVALLEESFHGDGGDYAGSWATVMGGPVNFRVLARRTLTVESSPISGVLIDATPSNAGGVTSYVTEVGEGTRVSLTAPATVTAVPTDYRFQRWLLNGVPQRKGRATLSFGIAADATVEAIYGQPALQVTYPSEPGLALSRGSTCVIGWTFENIPRHERVKIELYDSFGGSWVLAVSASNSGHWKWRVGKWNSAVQPVYPDGNKYRIRVSALDGGISDESDDEFGIETPAAGGVK